MLRLQLGLALAEHGLVPVLEIRGAGTPQVPGASVSGGHQDFREIAFGRWEGLTKEEIRASDPILYEDWQARKPGFEYPGGELRDAFRERVQAGLDGLLAADARDALLVLHKGVIRTIVETLTRETLPPDEPGLGEIVVVTRQPDGTWLRGQRSSNPPGLEAA